MLFTVSQQWELIALLSHTRAAIDPNSVITGVDCVQHLELINDLRQLGSFLFNISTSDVIEAALQVYRNILLEQQLAKLSSSLMLVRQNADLTSAIGNSAFSWESAILQERSSVAIETALIFNSFPRDALGVSLKHLETSMSIVEYGV